MIRVKADTPDAPFTIEIGAVKDSEGNPIPATDFSILEAVSDNPDAVSILDYADGKGTAHFGASNPDGSPAVANLKAEVVEKATGQVVFNITASVEVSHGDPVNFTGALTIEGHPDTETPSTDATVKVDERADPRVADIPEPGVDSPFEN